MIAEVLALSGAIGGYFYYKNPKTILRKQVNNMLDSNNSFYNKQGQQVKIKSIKENIITLDIKNVISFEDFLKKQDYVETSLSCNVSIRRVGKYIEIELKNKPKKVFNYEPVKTKEYELFCGLNEDGSPILVNMNKHPHMLIGGDTGTGKSVFLMMALSNLMQQHDNINLYMLQIRKSDLVVFKDCKQVKYLARDLKQTHALLRYLNAICIERDKKIERYMNKGILNIADYNNYFKDKPMKYGYIILDEFSFFIPSSGDTSANKKLKKEILEYVKNLVVSSRSSGIFIVTSLQKPTNSSIPTDIKAMLTTRVCFRIGDNATSLVVLNNGNATKLEDRKAIIKTQNEEVATMPTFTFKDVKQAIVGKIEVNKKYIDINLEDKKEIKPTKSIKNKKINLEEL